MGERVVIQEAQLRVAYGDSGYVGANILSAPLRGAYLRLLVDGGTPLPRRQDLPDGACWSAWELHKIKDRLIQRYGMANGGKRFGSMFVALSYRWLSPEQCVWMPHLPLRTTRAPHVHTCAQRAWQ